MKNNLFKGLMSLLPLFLLIGCGKQLSEQKKPTSEVVKKDNGIYSIRMYAGDIPPEVSKLLKENKTYFFQERKIHLFTKALQKAIDLTEAEGKKTFAFVQPSSNTLKGFPLNTYNDLIKYCIHLKRCDFNYEKAFYTLNILPIEDTTYEISVIDTTKMKEEIDLTLNERLDSVSIDN